VTAGAIAGPVVRLDLRTLYLRSLELYGSAPYRRDTFPMLMRVLAAGGITPIVHQRWPLDAIVDAQQAFLAKRHVGSMVLILPPVTG
jgi:NADPH:quinone reductase-like Zn-dependent oxidoreductase